MKAINFLNGKFGKRVLKDQYKVVWVALTYGTLAYLVFKLLLIPFFSWWSGIVSLLNHIVWG